MPDRKPKFLADTSSGVSGVFGRYAPGLHRYVTKRLRHPKDAPDLTQEIFERFIQVPHRDAIADPQAYLYSIASHLCSEWTEREARGLVTYDSDALDAVSQALEHAVPDDAADRLGIEQDLRHALAQLPPMHRTVLLLARREGMTHEEIAQRTGLLVSTVTNYVCEASARVKVTLKARGRGGSTS